MKSLGILEFGDKSDCAFSVVLSFALDLLFQFLNWFSRSARLRLEFDSRVHRHGESSPYHLPLVTLVFLAFAFHFEKTHLVVRFFLIGTDVHQYFEKI